MVASIFLDTTIAETGVVSNVSPDLSSVLTVSIPTNLTAGLTITGSLSSAAGWPLVAPVPVSTSVSVSAINGIVVLADATTGNIALTLPSATTFSGYHVFIKKIDASSNFVYVDGLGSETIDGSLTKDINTQYTAVHLVASGGNWYII